MKDIDSFTSKLQLTLEKLGTANGAKELAPSESQDPADADMHEFYVAQTAEALFKKRKEKALARLTDNPKTAETIARVVTATKKNDLKESATLISGQHFTFGIETRKASTRVNQDKMLATLQRQYGLTQAQIQQLIADCSEKSEPAKSFRASPIRE